MKKGTFVSILSGISSAYLATYVFALDAFSAMWWLFLFLISVVLILSYRLCEEDD